MSKEELENEQYDRQIRLWGLDAQRRMQSAHVLVCGLSGIHVEAAKNLVLCGVNLTIEDPVEVSIDDLSVNYFLSEDDIGKLRSEAAAPRIRELNPLATVTVGRQCHPADCDSNLPWAKRLAADYLRQFTAVLIADCSKSDAVHIDEICRGIGVALYWSSSYGSGEGWFAADLGPGYRFQEEGAQPQTPPPLGRAIDFPPFSEIWSVPLADLAVRKLRAPPTYVRFKLFEAFRDKFGRLPRHDDYATLLSMTTAPPSSSSSSEQQQQQQQPGASDGDREALAEAAQALPASWTGGLPVCSVVGGILAQEVLKVTTQTGAPIHNFFIFSTDDYSGRSLCVKSKK